MKLFIIIIYNDIAEYQMQQDMDQVPIGTCSVSKSDEVIRKNISSIITIYMLDRSNFAAF